MACGCWAWSSVSYNCTLVLLHTPHPHLIPGAIFGACSLLYNYKLYVYACILYMKNRKLLHAPKLAVAANLRYLKYACVYVYVLNSHVLSFTVNFAHIIEFFDIIPSSAYVYLQQNKHTSIITCSTRFLPGCLPPCRT